mmetsp:Transcript_13841/g.20450  ORF Transcript_13841/g.20450 Transcript_13841/m.20450 type:complete len:107 (+) Transcript_13841:1037-1357(+)
MSLTRLQRTFFHLTMFKSYILQRSNHHSLLRIHNFIIEGTKEKELISLHLKKDKGRHRYTQNLNNISKLIPFSPPMKKLLLRNCILPLPNITRINHIKYSQQLCLP